MKNTSFKMRTFNAGANHEIVLPNGKVVLIDPYFIRCNFPGFTRDDVTGADYIILTHSHFDHDSDLGYLSNKFNGKVFCSAQTADEILRFHKLPYDNIFPVTPGETYTLDGLTFHFWTAKHNESGARTYDPDRDMCKTGFGIEGHKVLDNMGSIFSLDWMITTENGFRVMMCSGRAVFAEAFDRCKQYRPNVLLRQSGVRHPENPGQQVPAKELAELLTSYHAQIVFPFHMDVLDKKIGHEATVAYMEEVAKYVSEIDPGCTFIYPEALKWYNVGIDVTVE